MKATHYFAVFIRLFALVLIIYVVRQSALLLELLTRSGWENYPSSLFFELTTVLCPLLVSLLLWFFPMTVAAAIIRPELNQPVESLSAVNILTVLLLAIGVYLLYFAVSSTIYWLTLWQINLHSYDLGLNSFSGENKAAMIATGLELVLALPLLARARTIATLMLKLTR